MRWYLKYVLVSLRWIGAGFGVVTVFIFIFSVYKEIFQHGQHNNWQDFVMTAIFFLLAVAVWKISGFVLRRLDNDM